MRLRHYATKSLTFYEFVHVYNKKLLCLKWLPLCNSTDRTPVAQTIPINYYKFSYVPFTYKFYTAFVVPNALITE